MSVCAYTHTHNLCAVEAKPQKTQVIPTTYTQEHPQSMWHWQNVPCWGFPDIAFLGRDVTPVINKKMKSYRINLTITITKFHDIAFLGHDWLLWLTRKWKITEVKVSYWESTSGQIHGVWSLRDKALDSDASSLDSIHENRMKCWMKHEWN